ncbi:11400_t:CDS:10, partial [Paraglomus brasilianum]
MTKSIKNFIINRFPSRRSELTVIRRSRISFLWLCYIGVLIYFCWKAYKLSQDERTFTYKKDNSTIPAPTTGDCNKYVNTYQNVNGGYSKTFKASDLGFHDPHGNANGPTLLSIILAVDKTDITDPAFTGGDAYLQAWFTDGEALADLTLASQSPGLKGVNNYMSTAWVGNNYYLANNQSYSFFFERKIPEPLNRNVVNVLSGKNGDHKPIPLISSVFVSYPNSAVGSYATVFIRPNSYVVITEIENSDLTVSDILSAVGGIYTAVMGVYMFLYGSDEMSPWGLIQNLPCIRRKVRSTLYDRLSHYREFERNQQDDSDNPNIPFVGPVLSKNLSSDEKFVAVEQRLLSLEFFLREYVVNVDNVVKNKTRRGAPLTVQTTYRDSIDPTNPTDVQQLEQARQEYEQEQEFERQAAARELPGTENLFDSENESENENEALDKGKQKELDKGLLTPENENVQCLDLVLPPLPQNQEVPQEQPQILVYLLSQTLDAAATSYFEETPYTAWSFTGFLTAAKGFWSTSTLSDDLVSTLKKRYTLYLKDISGNKKEVKEKRCMADFLLKQGGDVPRMPSAATQPGRVTFLPVKTGPVIKEILESILLDEKLALKEVSSKRKSEI